MFRGGKRPPTDLVDAFRYSIERMGSMPNNVLVKPTIKKVIFNEPATIVFFSDGDKVVVKTHNESFDKEKGLAMAVMKKLYSRSEFIRLIESAKED